MSDVPPPPPVPPTPPGIPPSVPPAGSPPPEPGATPPPDTNASLWDRYRALPMWLQVLIPVVILAVGIGIWAIAASGSDETTSSDTTVADSSMDDVLRGIIIAGGIRGETTTTTEVFTSAPTTEPTEPTTTVAPQTTLDPTTTAGADLPAPTTTPATTTPVPSAAPTTQAPTTEATTTTSAAAPPTTEVSASALPSPDDFLEQWNAAAERTDVPSLSRDQITQIVEGPFAGAFLATLSPTDGNKMAPQVGLIGTMSTTDPTQIAELLLVYVSGPDESASEFYWESFSVLAKAVDPSITSSEVAALEQSLGRTDGKPPFPDGTNNTANSNGFNYNLYTGITQDGTPATGIAVT